MHMRGASYLCRGSLALGALCLALLAGAEVWGAAELQARKEADEMLCSSAKLLLQSSALHPHLVLKCTYQRCWHIMESLGYWEVRTYAAGLSLRFDLQFKCSY